MQYDWMPEEEQMHVLFRRVSIRGRFCLRVRQFNSPAFSRDENTRSKLRSSLENSEFSSSTSSSNDRCEVPGGKVKRRCRIAVIFVAVSNASSVLESLPEAVAGASTA